MALEDAAFPPPPLPPPQTLPPPLPPADFALQPDIVLPPVAAVLTSTTSPEDAAVAAASMPPLPLVAALAECCRTGEEPSSPTSPPFTSLALQPAPRPLAAAVVLQAVVLRRHGEGRGGGTPTFLCFQLKRHAATKGACRLDVLCLEGTTREAEVCSVSHDAVSGRLRCRCRRRPATLAEAAEEEWEKRKDEDDVVTAEVLPHQTGILYALCGMLNRCALPHNLPEATASTRAREPSLNTRRFQEESVEVEDDRARVSRTCMVSQGSWTPQQLSYCGQLAWVWEMWPGGRTDLVALRHHDGAKVVWPLSVCSVKDDTLLADALRTAETLQAPWGVGLSAAAALKRGRGARRYDQESLVAAVRGMSAPASGRGGGGAGAGDDDALTWAEGQLILDGVARLQARRRLRAAAAAGESGAGFEAPAEAVDEALRGLMRSERRWNRLAQAPLLLEACDRHPGALRLHAWRHNLLSVVGGTPGLWERSPHWTAAEKEAARLDAGSLLGGVFAQERCTAAAMVASAAASASAAHPAPLRACGWALRGGRETRRLPEALRRRIAGYLLPGATLRALRARLEQARDHEGLEHGLKVFRDAEERATTAHDLHSARGLLALLARSYGAAQAHFRAAARCHRTDLPHAPPPPDALPYVGALFRCAAAEEPAAPQPPPPPWVENEAAQGVAAVVQLPPYAAPSATVSAPASSAAVAGEALHAASSAAAAAAAAVASAAAEDEEEAAAAEQHQHQHQGTQTQPPPPPPLPPPPALREGYTVTECDCGAARGGRRGGQLVYVTALQAAADAEGRRARAWDAAGEPAAQTEAEDLACNCAECLYHLALCADLQGGVALLEKADALHQAQSNVMRGRQSDRSRGLLQLRVSGGGRGGGDSSCSGGGGGGDDGGGGAHAAPAALNACEFTNSRVNLLLGLYQAAAGRLDKAARPFRVALALAGSSLAATWLAKLELRTGGGRRGRERAHALLTAQLDAMTGAVSHPCVRRDGGGGGGGEDWLYDGEEPDFAEASATATGGSSGGSGGVPHRAQDGCLPSLYYSDYARLAEARALVNYSLDDVNLALAKSPKHPVLHQLKAGILSDSGHGQRAIETLKTSIGYTYQAADLLQRALERLKRGRPRSEAAAVDDLCACLLFQPSNAEAKAALRRHRRRLTRDPARLLTMFYSRTGYVAKASCLFQWVSVQPNNPYVYCRISQFFFRLGNKRGVHDHWCNVALTACDTRWRPLFHGLLSESNREYEMAAQWFQEAVRCLPLEYECHLMLAYTLVSLKRYEESTKVLRCAVHLATHPSQCSIIYNNIGFNYHCCKMYETALYYFGRSKEYIPHLHYTFFNPYSNSSEIYFMLGEQGRAVNEIHNGLKVAIEVRPTMLEELLTKGMFRSVEEFFALCEQIKGLDPYNEFTYRYAAAVMWDSGNIGASLRELDEGIELTLGTQALVMRGELLRQFGQARATGYFAMALVLDPHNESALKLFYQLPA